MSIAPPTMCRVGGMGSVLEYFVGVGYMGCVLGHMGCIPGYMGMCVLGNMGCVLGSLGCTQHTEGGVCGSWGPAVLP